MMSGVSNVQTMIMGIMVEQNALYTLRTTHVGWHMAVFLHVEAQALSTLKNNHQKSPWHQFMIFRPFPKTPGGHLIGCPSANHKETQDEENYCLKECFSSENLGLFFRMEKKSEKNSASAGKASCLYPTTFWHLKM